jgi:hypothetical protein
MVGNGPKNTSKNGETCCHCTVGLQRRQVPCCTKTGSQRSEMADSQTSQNNQVSVWLHPTRTVSYNTLATGENMEEETKNHHQPKTFKR